MAWVAVAIGGSAILSAGTGIAGSMIAGDAARRAASAGLSQIDAVQWNAQNNLRFLESLYAPYINAGTNALSVLQGRVYSSAEQKTALAEQRIALENKVKKLSTQTDWNSFPVLVGEKASERRAALWYQTEYDRKQQLAAAQAELDQFNQTQSQLAPLYEQRDAEEKARQDRISTSLDRIAKLSDLPTSIADIRSELQNDPVYQFRVAEGERSINRAAAARGTFFSGAAMKQLRDFSLALTGEETDKYITRRLQALQAATTGLGAELSEQGQGVNQALSLTQLGLGAVQRTGAAITGTTQTQAQLASGAAQLSSNAELAQGQALQAGLGNVAGTAGSLAALTLLTQRKSDVGTTTAGSSAVNMDFNPAAVSNSLF